MASICFVVHTFPPYGFGGTELYTLWLARELAELGHRVVVFHPVTDLAGDDYALEKTEVEGLDVWTLNRHAHLPDQRLGDPRLERIFAAWLGDLVPDVVHFQHVCETLTPSLIEVASALGIPTVLTLHDGWWLCDRGHAIDGDGAVCLGPESPEKCARCLAGGDHDRAETLAAYFASRQGYLGRVLGMCDLISTPTDYVRRLGLAAGWPAASRIELAPIGLAPFQLSESPRRQVDVPTRISAAGNFVPFQGGDLKGAWTLIRAFKGLPAGRFELHVHGKVEGPWLPEFERIPGVFLHGPYSPDERAEIYGAADVLVLSSQLENYPTVVREALYAGVPVVATRTGGVPEIVVDGENGLLVEPESPSDLRAALLRLAEEPGLLERLRAGVKPPLLIAEDAASWERRYQDLVGDPAPPETDKVISVVIATYDRRDWLCECLEGFCRQTLPARNFEVVVVDDCGSVDLSDLVAGFEKRVTLRYIRHERNSGLGACRNTGSQEARGEIVLFFDDDDRPAPRFLAEHVRTHLEFPDVNVAVLGYTAWAPELAVSPVMHHVTQVGKQYLSYPDIPAGVPLDWHYCWGGRSSVKRALLDSESYDPDFHMLEDMELSWRLRRVGLQVVYNPRAVQYGMRELDLAYFCKRWFRQGQGIAQVLRKHLDPELVRHFGVGGAEGTWAALEPRMAELAQQIAKLEAIPVPDLRRIPVNDTLPSAEDLLHHCYRLYFEGFRLKGYLEALESGVVARGGMDDAALGATQDGAPCGPLKLLFLAPELPLFDRSSGGFRLFQIVKLAREAGHEVTYIARRPGDVPDALPYVAALEALGVEVYPYDPDKILATWDEEVDQPRIDLQALLEERRFDLAYCYFYEIADLYREELRTFSPATRLVIDSVDLHFLRELRRGELTGDARQIERALEVRDKELASYASADLVVMLTDADREAALAVDPSLKIEVLPNIHPIPEGGAAFAARRHLVFVGGFAHRPNVEAMQEFCDQVWPAIAERLPGVKLFIVGANPPPAIEALAGERIVVTGYVPDTLPYLRQCRVSIAPLRYGAGMKGKVGEALAAGLPVVGTGIAFEGMGLAHLEHVLIADDPQATIEAICELYTGEALWNRLAAAGRAHMEKHYSPAAVAGALDRVFGISRPGAHPQASGAEPPGARSDAAATAKPQATSAVRTAGQPRTSYKASIVIPVWNRVEFTTKCLEALAESIPEDFSYEVVVVDNGSTDDTPSLLASLGGDVQVVTNKTNLGFARACNQGAAVARGEWIVFLNNDTEPRPGWLEALIALGEREDRAGIVGAKLLYPDGTIQHAGVAFTAKAEGKFVIHGEHFDKDVFIEQLPYHLYRKMPADAPYVNKVRDFQVVTGACLAIRHELFEAIGGFDEAFKNGFEDVDLCLKALQRDWRVLYCPASVVIHHESKSEGRHDHDLPNARLFHERWSDFIVPDDVRFYQEDGFVAESPQEHLTVWRYQDSFGRAEAHFAAGRLAEALAEYEAFLAVAPDHDGARIRVAVIRERLAAKV